MTTTAAPALRMLSLGAGVQSTTLLLLSAQGRIPRYDLAAFADTGWEPARVHAHLDRIEAEIARPAGIELVRVGAGDIRADGLHRRFVTMPVHIVHPNGRRGIGQRQCTKQYKLDELKRLVRERLGYPHPRRVPDGVYALQDIGISRDELHRAKDSRRRYLRNDFPLLDLTGAADGHTGWTRADCARHLRAHGWGHTPRSACVGCPMHTDREWRDLRDTSPDEWAQAVAFDHALRTTAHPDGIREYLHRSCVPLDEAPIDRISRREWKDRQGDILAQHADRLAEEDRRGGCSPWGCHDEADGEVTAA
ncbi:hypothetical protein [Embleya sp. NPDC001921]